MAGRIVETLQRAKALSVRDWRYLGIAVWELFLARIRHATEPIGTILRELKSERPPCQSGKATEVDMMRLSWALDAAATLVPWRSDCLIKVMAADSWLRRYGLTPEFFLGVTKDSMGTFGAHAWLRCDDVNVTGGRTDEFTPIMKSSSPQNVDLLK